MRQISISILLALLVVLPVSAQVKNVDWSIYEVKRAVGRSQAYQGAVLEAKRSAVDDAANALFLHSDDERTRYQAHREQILEGLSEYLRDFQITNKYRENGKVVLESTAVILREPLKSKIRSLGIVKESLDTIAGAEKPRILAALSWSSEDRPLSSFTLGRINDYLSQQQLDVVDLSTLRELLGDDERIASADSASSVDLALKSQADIYLLLSADVRRTRSIGANSLYQAYVTIEGRTPFGSQPFDVQEYRSRELTFEAAGDREKAKRAAIEEAVGGAIEPLVAAIERKWKAERKLGKPYRITFQAIDPMRLAPISDQLRSFSTIIQESTTSRGTSYTVRYTGKLEDLLERLITSGGEGLEVSEETPTEALMIGR